MKIGFYYHIPIHSANSKLYVPGYLGVFIDSLAKNVEFLYLTMHESTEDQIKENDYELKQKNIKWINLGHITPAWHRHFYYKRILKKTLKFADCIDFFIIRSPTPLSPFFKNFIVRSKIIFLVVGDYLEGSRQFKIKNLRDWIMIQYLKRNDSLLRKAMQNSIVMVNSIRLLNQYNYLNKHTHLIKTTTLSCDDFFERTDTCKNETIELLYTGRIETGKGVFEMVNSLAELRKLDINARLNIVGWEVDSKKSIEKALLKAAKELNVEEFIIFHGRKKIGVELNELYQKADIYIIPSYHEGFPRTIWEAMANSLPVIASNVGGIPDYLTDYENALFVEPKNSNDLVDKIQLIINNKDLREKMIRNGYQLAKENTLEIQTEKMMDILKKFSSKKNHDKKDTFSW